MATVRANCADCGDVEMSIRQVQVEVCRSTDLSTYSFLCPKCRLRASKAAAPHVVQTLLAAGATLVYWEMPAELWEVKSGPAITHDDLLAFHYDLDEEGWLQRSLSRQRAA